MRPLHRVSLLSLATTALLAGCGTGGTPQLAREDVAPLISLADRISREGPCAQARDIRRLDRERTRLVNEHRIPSALADSLSSGVNALVAQMPACVPAVTPSADEPQPTVTTGSPPPGPHAKHDKHGHGHGHGHGDEGGD